MTAEIVVTGWDWLNIASITIGAFLGGTGFGMWLCSGSPRK